ncbi:hypothetical protein AVMA1855_06895 [Acidovorax sp. SUPP1855]|uniref:hypothetical protein n=1 Tax=Acidovorax sp. SUPP1855 TaxID=431774 RepID=UPI0023DE43DF|nr:hypothetical protein [Acidovorax sp. SUPP1855]GKS83853.1 hypothetical protein AVMA1855_06895 [Acidovorax sp. SUPP1855]
MADNGTVGRVQTMMCTPADPKGQGDPTQDRLEELSQRYANHASGKVPLPPEESLWLRGEIDRLSQLVTPGQPNIWGDYSAAEKHYMTQQAEQQQRNANNIGMAFLGPFFGAPMAAARAVGAPEPVVEKLGELGINLASAVSLRGIGGGRVIEPVAQRNGNPVLMSGPMGGRNGVVVRKRTYDAKDFLSEHAYKRHGNDPDKPSKPNHTRYSENVDPKKIANETINNPDKVEKLYDANGNHYATKYSKDMGYNISQPPVNSSQSRVFINHVDPTRSTQFPFGK